MSVRYCTQSAYACSTDLSRVDWCSVTYDVTSLNPDDKHDMLIHAKCTMACLDTVSLELTTRF